MKSKRQEKILELIADHSVQTQEQLLAELNEAGFSTTQATISRDIKQLRIIKELGPNGVYRYATAPKPAEHTFSAKLNLIFRQCITSVDYAQNMIVVKTMPGLARRRLRNRQAEHPGNAWDACGRRYVLRCAEGHAGRCRALRRDPGADRALRPERNRRKTDAFYPAYRKYCRDRTGRDRL